MAKQLLTFEIFYDGSWHALALQNDSTVDELLSVRNPIEITRGRADESTGITPGASDATVKNGSGIYNPRNPDSPLFGVAGRNAPVRMHLGVPHPGAASFDLVASTSHVAPSLTPPGPSGILICGWSGPFPAGSYTAPGSMTESLDQSDAQQTMMVARQVVAGSTATGTKTATASASETYVSASVLVHGPTALTTGAIGSASGLLTVDGNAGDWWIVFGSFGWSDPDDPVAAFPRDSDTGGWILLADTGTIESGDVDANCNRMKAWGKRIKTTDAAHTINVDVPDGGSLILWLTRIPAAEIDSHWSMRMHGEVSSWKPNRPIKGTPTTDFEIGGLLRRLTQGTPPVMSAAQRAILGQPGIEPAAYWPMLGPEPLAAGAAPMYVSDITGSASPDLSWVTGESAPKVLHAFSTGGRDIYVRPRSGFPCVTSVVVDSSLSARPTTNTSAFTLSNRIGTFFVNVIGNWVTGVPTLTLTSNSGTIDTAAAADATRVWDESAHAFRVDMTQNGANIDIEVYLDGTLIMNGSTASTALSSADVFLPGLISAGRPECVWGHVTIWGGTVPALATIHNAMRGHPGETAGARFLRICAELGITAAMHGDPDDTQHMGPQFPDTTGNLLQEIERTDDGYVFDLREAVGLGFRTGRSRYNQLAALELDYEAFHLAGWVPVVDDYLTHNDVTAANREGSEVRAEQTSGPLNVNEPTDDPEGVGRYPHRVDVNVFSDSVLPEVATWHLGQGTTDETRWPIITIDLDATPLVEAAVSSLDPGDRITIDNHPDSYDQISLIYLGSSEKIESHHRVITLNCIPERPFHVLEVEHELYSIIGSNTATLNEDLDTTETGIDVVLGHCGPWVHEVDFDIVVGGERMTLTAVGAAAGTFPTQTQTFTVSRSVNGVVKTHATGARVELFSAARYGY